MAAENTLHNERDMQDILKKEIWQKQQMIKSGIKENNTLSTWLAEFERKNDRLNHEKQSYIWTIEVQKWQMMDMNKTLTESLVVEKDARE